ncbi:hypothetical protein NOR_08052 [Metarhizium rileyi]|uniref:Uncharacterized protein n=1 Tax=Metarhizium rileyi (strain RCEF 4871) TaxID=1649241 RepID=A0A166X0L4_METRR|nr:hypothetical protein NOR_08052 [Metarhizium rileyi RCEF 4871]
MDRGGDTAPSGLNGRPQPNQLQVNREARRPLFSSNGPRSVGNAVHSDSASATASAWVGAGERPGALGAAGHVKLTRRAKSDPQSITTGTRKTQDFDPNASNASVISPGGSRIPRFNITGLQHGRPISLKEAFKLAREEEEEAERERQQGGSPSPAPRIWRARPGQHPDETQAREMMAEDPLDSKARTRTRQSTGAKISSAQSPDAKARSTATVLEADVAKKGGGLSLQERINEWRTKSRPSADWAEKSSESPKDTGGEARLPELVPGIEDVPFQSVEPPSHNGAIASPLKDFTWQVDHDFTAGDLQVSDSPRIKVGNKSNQPFANRPSILDRIDIRSPARKNSPGTRNTTLDEIRARELNVEGSNSAAHSSRASQHPRKYTKLEEIRAREAAAEKQIPIPGRNQPRPKNTKIDEIRQREAEGLSRRAVAAARLEEIREKNAMTRSLSPDKGRLRSRLEDQVEMRPPARPKPVHEDAGERVPNTPVTVFKSYRPKQENIDPDDAATSHSKEVAAVKPAVDERDLLRRLARAASSSPAPEAVNQRAPLTERQKPNESDRVVTKPILAGRSTNNGPKSALSSQNKDRDMESARPTVGFAGLKRMPSTESAESKRSSMHSESDPTARIEAEAKLFAPRDDYSEPGSVRAPSPGLDSGDDDVAEATPKPEKHEFLHMDTPRVTGAYVETPVTAKVDKVKEEGEELQNIKPLKERLSQGLESSKPDTAALFRDEKTSLSWRNKDEDTASEPGARGDNAGGDSAGKKARSRSLPRRRPPVTNSARPPSVKEDLRELQRQHNIDDSAMDDLEEILTGRKHASPKLKQLLEGLPVKAEGEIDGELKAVEEEMQRMKRETPEDKDMSAGEMALFNKMSKTLRTGLSSIRTAKLGIQRLEDQVAHAEKQASTEEDEAKSTKRRKKQRTRELESANGEACPQCTASPDSMSRTYVYMPLPRLLYTSPHLRLSWFGLVVTIALIWYTAESAMCWKYCRPAACTSAPCVYAYDDPTFGYALPVKLDQWSTGGNGRRLAAWVWEELQDWAANIEDAVHGRSLEDAAVDQLSGAERRQHRRRLQKRGLVKPATRAAAPDQRAKWDAWRRTRLERERSRELRDMGYEAGNGWAEDVIGGDERVW